MSLPLDLEQDHVPNLPERPHTALMELFCIAGPTIAQMASYTVMQFIDAWMLSSLGATQPTAAGNAGIFAWCFISFGIGVISLINTLVSQNYGAKNFPQCGRFLWQGIWFALLFTLLTLPLLLVARPLFAVFKHAPDLAAMEVSYFRIVMLTAGVKLIANSLAQFLLGVNHPTQVFAASVFGVLANAIAAWGLILGHFGLPRLEVVGAAWAQNIGVTVEMLVLLAFVLRPATRRLYHVGLWRLKPDLFRTLLRVGIPSGAQFAGDILAWAIFANFLVGAFGTVAMSATNFTFRYMHVSFMPAIGMGTAVTCLVGRYIGRGQIDLAVRRTHLAFMVTAIFMMSCGVGFFVFRHQLMGVFTQDPQVIQLGGTLLVLAALWQFFDAQFIIYSGALRGAGDTFAPAVALICLNWSITIAGGFAVTRLLPQFGAAGPWSAALAYGIILGAFCFLRFRAGKWKAIRLAR